MKILFLECSAEEIRANKRLMDDIIECWSKIADDIVGNAVYTSEPDEQEETEGE